ncbi:MAG: hypothetical protein ACJATD_000104 [Alloalcanivorax sp.]|jgi:hypothetical protein
MENQISMGEVMIKLSIDRIAIHQIFRRDQNGDLVTPERSHDFTLFDDSAMDAFKSRVVDALGDGSNAVSMEIENEDDDGLPALMSKMINSKDKDFLDGSYEVAKKLARAQNRKNIPGGIVVVFSGRSGVPHKRFVGIIKAEIYTGYEKHKDEKTKKISLKYVEELLLTPGTRLYKTAAFIDSGDSGDFELNASFKVLVSDHQINQADGKAAARYFYSGFLGLKYPDTSARKTKLFYDTAKEFIGGMDVSSEDRYDLMNALNTYMKVDKGETISCSDFSKTYFDVDTQDLFKEFMVDSGVPEASFIKDIEHISSVLKMRKMNFGGNIKITAPPDAFKKSVTVETVKGEPDTSGDSPDWTRLTIKQRLINQE